MTNRSSQTGHGKGQNHAGGKQQSQQGTDQGQMSDTSRGAGTNPQSKGHSTK